MCMCDAPSCVVHLACSGIMALIFENVVQQNLVCKESGVQLLGRLMRAHASDRVLCQCVRTIGKLCLGVAYCNNAHAQAAIAEENLLAPMVLLILSAPNVETQVEVSALIHSYFLCFHILFYA